MNKLSKIAPIVVVVACLGSLFFVFKIAGQKKDMRGQIDGLTTDKQQLESSLASTKKELATTKTALDKTKEDLSTTTANLTATQTKLTEKTQEADGLKAQLDGTIKELDQAKLDRDAAQKNLKDIQEALGGQDIKSLTASVVAQADENKILGKQLMSMRDENQALRQKVEELSTTPTGLRGRIAAVQDNWGFVVLDIGHSQHVTANAQFIVYRDSKMVGKVQVLNVGPTTSVAQILPEFQKNSFRVGDTVVH
jgi:septal ring factor EnvC (AmiA/AmiB activator)